MYVCAPHACVVQEGAWKKALDPYDCSYRCWELNPGPQGEQSVLLLSVSWHQSWKVSYSSVGKLRNWVECQRLGIRAKGEGIQKEERKE